VRPDRLSPVEASAASVDVDVPGGRGLGRRIARPVFLDRSGTRRRLLTVFAAALGCGLFGALTLLVLAFSGASPVPIPGFPQNHPATSPPAAGPSAQAGGALTTSGAGSLRSAPTTTPLPGSATPSPTPTRPGHSHTPHPSRSK
jgi:hypothetical protein